VGRRLKIPADPARSGFILLILGDRERVGKNQKGSSSGRKGRRAQGAKNCSSLLVARSGDYRKKRNSAGLCVEYEDSRGGQYSLTDFSTWNRPSDHLSVERQKRDWSGRTPVSC